MSDIFHRYSGGRPPSEQGCVERLIGIILILVVASICIGAIFILVSVLAQTP